MTSTTYRIVRQPDDTFAVEVLRVGALPERAAGFATEAAVKGWIEQDKRLSGSSDLFQTAAGRRWRQG